uniref:Putative leucine rich repeat some n=1 Tax=Amblyomma aureolatum TaxID=187763 RepID=A0A1E1X614_9ACAR
MPRRKTPKPLYRLCVVYVAGTIQSLCPAHDDAVASVFPPHVSEDLVDALQSYKQSNFTSLHHLLTHRLRRIRLSFIDCHLPIDKPSRLPRLLRQISEHGKQLVDLSLVGAVHQDDATLVEALCKLPRLRRLTLCLCNVTDRVVCSIAEHCRELSELKLSGQRVTDESLYLLVACSQLRSLLLESDMCFDPRISVASSFHLLRGLPHLQTLKIPFLTEALLLFPEGCKLSLVEYMERGLSPLLQCTTALPHIVSICPSLTRVSLILTGQEAILSLGHLKSLTDLTLRVIATSSERFFRRQVEPVLRMVGSHLKTLTLSLPDLDVAAISEHCPVLTDLEMEDLRTLILSDQPPTLPPTHFRQLQRLKFFPHEMNTVTPEQLFDMLRDGGKLTEACLGWCQLTDTSLEALVASGTFANLREFELNEVEYVSGAGLRSLVAADSELASLTVFGCDFVSRADIDRLREQVAEQNLDLVIRYFEL